MNERGQRGLCVGEINGVDFFFWVWFLFGFGFGGGGGRGLGKGRGKGVGERGKGEGGRGGFVCIMCVIRDGAGRRGCEGGFWGCLVWVVRFALGFVE